MGIGPDRGEFARPLEWHLEYPEDGAGMGRHDDDAIGHGHRFIDRVRDEDHGFASLFPYSEDLLLEDEAGLLIECAERFIHQQEIGIDRQRSRDRDTLAHSL